MNLFKTRVALTVALTTALLAGCFGNSPEQYVETARKALGKGDRNAAIIDLKNALQKNPQMGEARFLLAQTLYEGGDLSSAEIELGKATDAGYVPDKVAALKARLMLARGQKDKVLGEFGQTKLASAHEMSDLQTSLADASVQAGKLPEALALVDAALTQEPNSARALMLKVRLLVASKRTDEASAVIDALIAKDEKNSEAWRTRGDLLVSLGKPDDAIAAYRQSSKLNKRNIASRAGAFLLLMQKRDLAGASTELDGLREVARKHPLTQFYTAFLAYERNQLKEARDAIQGVLKTSPNDPRLLLLAGRIEYRRGALLEAEAYLNKLLAASPDNLPARALLAQTQLREGDFNKALATLQPALVDDGQHLAALEVAAEAYMQAGDNKQAEAYFAMVAKANPDDVRSRVALAVSEARQGRFDQGVTALRALAASDPGMMANFGLINLHMEKKDYAQALADLDDLQRKAPGNPFPIHLRGRVALVRNDPAKAREAFEEALKVDPAYYPSVAALAKLDVESKDYNAAAARFQKVLASQPKSLQANMGLIGVREQAGASKAELADMLSKVVELLPGEAGPRLALVNLQLQRKENKLALSAAQGAAAALPDNAEVQAALGRAQASVGDFDQAISAFNKQITANPNSPQSYMTLAELYASRKDMGMAAKTLNRALAVKADYLPAQAALLAIALSANDFGEAGKIAQAIKQQRPKEAVGFVMAGDVEFAQKHWSAAASGYRTALGFGASTELALKLHQALLQSGNVAGTKAFESEWLSAHAGDTAFLFYLGDRALEQRDYALAEQRYSSVLKMQPENVLALNNVAWLLMQGKKPGALDYAIKANKLAPDQPALMDTLAEAYAKAGQLDMAVETEKKVVARLPDNAAYRLTLARYYIAQGQKESAKQELTRLAGLSDKLPQQQEAKKLLATL